MENQPNKPHLHFHRRIFDDRLEGEFALNLTPVRFSYYSTTKRGVPEYVFSYASVSDIPTPETEPELFDIPHEKEQKGIETWLVYKSAIVILATKESDDEYRKKHPDIVSKGESFMIEFKREQ